MKTWQTKIILLGVLVFVVAITILNVVTFHFTYSASNDAKVAAQQASADGTAIQTLLTNGTTSSAVNARQTKAIAQQIENLVIAYHAQNQQAAQAAVKAAAASTKAQKSLPGLLRQIETAISDNVDKQIGAAVDRNHASGLVTREILCAGAQAAHPNDQTIKRLCS